MSCPDRGLGFVDLAIFDTRKQAICRIAACLGRRGRFDALYLA